MKKFIKRCLILFFLIVTSVAFLNYRYIHTRYYQSELILLTEKFKTVPDHIQFANVGSSHEECDFDYIDITPPLSML
jgi:hypothetical protein